MKSVFPASRKPVMRYTGMSIGVSLQAEQGLQAVLLQLGADDAQAAGVVGGAIAHLVLLGHIVKVQPLAVGGGHDALGPQDGAVVAGIQSRQNAVDIRLGELLGSPRPSW